MAAGAIGRRRRASRRAMRCGRRAPYADPQTAPGRSIDAPGTDQQRALNSQVAGYMSEPIFQY